MKSTPTISDSIMAAAEEALLAATTPTVSSELETNQAPDQTPAEQPGTPLEPCSSLASYLAPLDPILLDQPTPPPAISSLLQTFRDIPDQIREQDQVNTYEVKRLNLAAAMEALDRAVQSHAAMPSPDAAFAVSSLSEQVMKLTKELEKSQDPHELYDRIVGEIIEKMTEHVVFTVGAEMKWLISESQKIVPAEKQQLITDTIKNATRRVAPSLSEVLEISKSRLLKILDLKEKKT